MTLLKHGYFDPEELEQLPGFPSEERLAKGPCVVIECAQEIPCNPCEAACRQAAIEIGDNITNLPKLNPEKCTGCGLCIAACPGQAIFVVDKTYSDTRGTVQFPYEYLPYPEVGDKVQGVNRAGEAICEAEVLKVIAPRSFDHTAVITVAVPKAYTMEVRTIRIQGE